MGGLWTFLDKGEREAPTDIADPQSRHWKKRNTHSCVNSLSNNLLADAEKPMHCNVGGGGAVEVEVAVVEELQTSSSSSLIELQMH